MSLQLFLAKPSRDLREWIAIDGCWWGWNFLHSPGRVSRQLFHIERHTKWFAAVSSFKADWKKPFALGNFWEWRHSEKLPQNRDKLSDFRIAWKLRFFFSKMSLELWPWQVKLKKSSLGQPVIQKKLQQWSWKKNCVQTKSKPFNHMDFFNLQHLQFFGACISGTMRSLHIHVSVCINHVVVGFI